MVGGGQEMGVAQPGRMVRTTSLLSALSQALLPLTAFLKLTLLP